MSGAGLGVQRLGFRAKGLGFSDWVQAWDVGFRV